MVKAKQAWYCNYKLGKIKELYFKYLQHKYMFQHWHTTPINFRPYAIGIVNYLNKQRKKKVVEIGCGLGEIVGNITNCERMGVDVDTNVIKVAKKLYRKTNFEVGTFENIRNQKIDYLITVNFIHRIPSELLKEKYSYLCRNNDIRHIVLDIVDSPEYQFNHDIDYLSKELGYRVKKRLHRYQVTNGSRWIYILERNHGDK
ncbi:MAG: methyltransferase domain-containing protein [Lachnospiraceae bacterium]|nr:methyltransferase domain-containing protein [Lachnospiraceae bacterium]